MKKDMSNKNYFLGIGAEKAGTTWLAKQLERHPQIFVTPHKEIHYFDDLYINEGDFYRKEKFEAFKKLLEVDYNEMITKPGYLAKLKWYSKQSLTKTMTDKWYLNLFEIGQSKKHKVFGEITPGYSALPNKGWVHVKKLLPNAKIIFLMRDPVERMWSAIRYFQKNRPKATVMESVENMINFAERENNYMKTDYVNTLHNLNEFYDKKNILTGFYEDIFHDENSTLNFLDKTCDFLNVDFDKSMFPQVKQKINTTPSSEIPPQLKEHLSNLYLPIINGVKKELNYVPTSWGK